MFPKPFAIKAGGRRPLTASRSNSQEMVRIFSIVSLDYKLAPGEELPCYGLLDSIKERQKHKFLARDRLNTVVVSLPLLDFLLFQNHEKPRIKFMNKIAVDYFLTTF